MDQIDVSLVVSVFNEEKPLPLFWQQTRETLETLDCSFEVIFVNDGSTDGSMQVLKGFLADAQNVRIVNLSRNFGHEAAMLAGIDHSTGQVTICLDADCQHPPALIPRMLESHREGNRVVHMVREESHDLGWWQGVKARAFYKILNLISPEGFTLNASDFFLIDRTVSDLLKVEFRERARFLRGFIQVVGFTRATIPFDAPKRASGETKYSFLRLLNLSITALATFSRMPLRLGLLLGIVFSVLSAIVGVYSIIMKILGEVITGYTTIVVLSSFLFSIQLIVLGIIGEYVGFIFEEVKRRPIYVLESLLESPPRRQD